MIDIEHGNGTYCCNSCGIMNNDITSFIFYNNPRYKVILYLCPKCTELMKLKVNSALADFYLK